MKLLVPGLIVGGALLISQFAKNQTNTLVDRVQVDFEGLDNFKVSLLYTDFAAKIRISNPSLIPVPVQNITGTITKGETVISNISYLESFKIPANDRVSVGINVRLSNTSSIINIAQTLKNLIANGTGGGVPKFGYKMNIFINLGVTEIPFSFDF